MKELIQLRDIDIVKIKSIKNTMSDFIAEVKVAGFKHAFVSIVAAAVCCPNTKTLLTNVPMIEDTIRIVEILRLLGLEISCHGSDLLIDSSSLLNSDIPCQLSSKVHGTLYLLAPVLIRRKAVSFSTNMGGCPLGKNNFSTNRPFDHIVEILKKFGVKCQRQIRQNRLVASLDRIIPCSVDVSDYSYNKSYLSGPLCSGATKMSILLALGTSCGETTRIIHPYLKQDVLELLKFIEKVGVKIQSSASDLYITSSKMSNSVDFSIIPDLIEIMTYITMSVFLDIPAKIKNIKKDVVIVGLKKELEYLKQMGINLEINENEIFVPHQSTIHPVHLNVKCMDVYSDSQPFFALLSLKANGISTITDEVWNDRFGYVSELKKMGACMELINGKLVINPSVLHAPDSVLKATDLRCAASLLIAALSIKDESVRVKGCNHIKRGYEDFFGNLSKFGADIEYEKIN